MEVRNTEVGLHWFPFSELINGNQFVLQNNEAVLEKTGRNTYRDSENHDWHLEDSQLHSTKVQLRGRIT